MKDHHYFVYIVTNPKKLYCISALQTIWKEECKSIMRIAVRKKRLLESTFATNLSILNLSKISEERLKGKRKSKT